MDKMQAGKKQAGKKQAGRRKHTPLRSCIICRRKIDKRQLRRIVRTPDKGVVVDPSGKQNGRGAYLCDQQSCWTTALREPGHLNRALNMMLTPDDLAAVAEGRPETVAD